MKWLVDSAMDKYGDEEFIRILKQRQEAVRNKDIRKGSVFADGEVMVFQEREILKRKLWMWMPDDFELPGRETAQLKYPGENRPDIIYMSPDTTVNVTFTRKTEKLEPGEEEQLRDGIEQQILRLYPQDSKPDKQTVEAENSRLAWFDFVSPAVDMDIYNLMFVTSFQGKMLLGACNCLSGDREDWKDLFLQMLASVRMG